MGDWVVETPSFEEQLMNNRIIGLNKKGVDNVVIIIKRKNNEIERLNKIINEVENYIRARADDNNTCSICSVMTDDLLNILKGSDKE